MPPDARVPVGVQSVVEHDGHRLMLRRGGTEWYADGRDSWAHPGGWLDFGEHPLDAAARETQEEYYAGEPTVMESEKCPEVTWVPLDRVETLPLFAPTRAYQDKYAAA
jgi:hypothetical protein